MEDELAELIKYILKKYEHLDGPRKVVLLNSAATYIENLTTMEMKFKIMAEAFNKVK